MAVMQENYLKYALFRSFSSFSGERLDIKQSESLEEIFKHVRFRCLDLEATHLDDEVRIYWMDRLIIGF